MQHRSATKNEELFQTHHYRSLRAHGFDNYNFAVLEFLPDISLKELRRIEKEYIVKFGQHFTLNAGDPKTGGTGGSQAIPVKLINTHTKDVLEFRSISAAARHLGLTRVLCDMQLVIALSFKKHMK